MPDAKGKTPVRADVPTDADESGDAFESVSFLEDANALLEKVKTTAENVTTCQVCAFSRLATERGCFLFFWGVRARGASPGMESRATVVRCGTDRFYRTRLRSCSIALVY